MSTGRTPKNLGMGGMHIVIFRVVRAPSPDEPEDQLSADEQETSAPAGALVPIPGVPNFRDTPEAKKWLSRNAYSFGLNDKKVAIVEFKEIYVITAEPVVRSKTTMVRATPDAVE